jgi:hypothetical protein
MLALADELPAEVAVDHGLAVLIAPLAGLLRPLERALRVCLGHGRRIQGGRYGLLLLLLLRRADEEEGEGVCDEAGEEQPEERPEAESGRVEERQRKGGASVSSKGKRKQAGEPIPGFLTSHTHRNQAAAEGSKQPRGPQTQPRSGPLRLREGDDAK